MLDAIEKSTTKIEFVTFVYWSGDIADKFASALAKKAKQGVKVKVLLDSYGARLMNQKELSLMEGAGVEIRWFRPLSTWRIWRSDKRTHRKILLCDDTVGFIGGVGIADEWSGNANNSDEWRETHSQIRGPVVLALRAAFLDNWNEAGGWSAEAAPQGEFQTPLDDGVPIQVITASTTIGWTRISTLMRTLISIAKTKLTITTAYFAPEPLIIELLCQAAERGVDTQILVPGQETDSRLSQLAGQPEYHRLLSSGVKIWRYERTMLHAKVMTVDDHVCCIGSANFNHRSLSKDEECSFIGLSESLVSELNDRFSDDCNNAEQLKLEQWAQRSRLERLKERCAKLLIEQL